MKINLLLFALLFSTTLFGQTPAYFDNNQEWLSSYSFYSPGLTDCVQNSTYADYVNGDTLIGGITYTKIGRRTFTAYFPMSSAPCSPDWWGDVPSHRILRQSNDSIFEYSTQNNTEELLISYNLNVGDVFSPTSYININYTVQQIDTIVLNGQNHRGFSVDTINDYRVIEGVGHYSYENGGFLNNWGFWGGMDQVTALNCYAQNGTTYWSHPNITLGSCNYLHDLSVDNLDDMNQLLLFPNPVSELINIESQFNINSIKIMSLNGTVIREQESSLGIKSVNVNDLSQGSYLIIVQDVEGRRSIRRFQKN